MAGMILNVDATPFSTILNHTLAYVVRNISDGSDVSLVELFDTVALPVLNSAGRRQLEGRPYLKQRREGTWVSDGSFVPMRLRYQLFQGNEPLRMDVSVKGDLELGVTLDTSAKLLEIEVKSSFSANILDPIRVNGRDISIPDVLYLNRILLRPGRIDYAFRRRSDSEDYITVVAAWTEETVKAFGGQAVAIQFSSENFATRVLTASLAKFLTAKSCKPGGGNGDKKTFSVWARSSDGSTTNGYCYILDVCSDKPPTGRGGIYDKKIGCYPSFDQAKMVLSSHAWCSIGDFPFEAETNTKKGE